MNDPAIRIVESKEVVLLYRTGHIPGAVHTEWRAVLQDQRVPDYISTGDAAFISKGLGDIARPKGMSQIARQTGMSRESLYNELYGERGPSFDTILKVISTLGLKLSTSVKEVAIVEEVAEVA